MTLLLLRMHQLREAEEGQGRTNFIIVFFEAMTLK
jgi:hypothetical protein